MFVDGIACNFSCEGDPEAVARWIPFARNLFRQMRANGVQARAATPATGVLIRVAQVAEGNGQIRIEAGGCPALVSGLFDLVLPPKPILGGIDPIWDLLDSTGKPYQAVRRFYPRAFGKDGSSSYGPWGESKILAKNYTKDETANRGGTFLTKTPGKFTGLMRGTVQALLGQGVPVYYEYGFWNCHGIFKASDGTPWVIEISSARGVTAWKLPTCKSAKTGKDPGVKAVYEALGFYPLLDKKPLNSKDRLTLLPASLMNVWWALQPFFPTCGWAFDYTGHAVQNTAWEMGPDGYLIGYRYKLEIIEHEGKPYRALLSQQESGVIHGNRVSGFKVPLEGGPVSMIDFDLNYDKNPPYLDSNGPLYVFYAIDSSEVVVRMAPGLATIPESQPPSGLNYMSGAVVTLDNVTTHTGNLWRLPAPRISIGPDNESGMTGSYEMARFTQDRVNGFFTSSNGSVPGANVIMDEGMTGRGSALIVSGGTHSFHMSVAVPWYDRESAYCARFTEDAAGMRQDFIYEGFRFVRGTIVGVLNYTPAGPCSGGNGYMYSPQFASDPRIGFHSDIWFNAGFAKKLPFLPAAEGEVACSDAIPYWSTEVTASIQYAYRFDTDDVIADIALYTSSGQYPLFSTAMPTAAFMDTPLYGMFQQWTLESGDHFLAVYRDAFPTVGGNRLYAYKLPNRHDDILCQADPYPSDLDGNIKPRFFVGAP